MKLKQVVLGSIFAAIASVANAGLLDGKTVKFEYFYPDLSSPYYGSPNGNYVVGAGVEVSPIVDGNGALDLQSDGFTVNFGNNVGFSNGTFNGFVISDVNSTIAPFTSFTLITNTAGGPNPTLSFDADNLYVNWQGLSYSGGELVFAVNAVPEPETYAMLLAGVGLLGFVARRRKQALAA